MQNGVTLLQVTYQQTVTQQINSLPPPGDTETGVKKLLEIVESAAPDIVGDKN